MVQQLRVGAADARPLFTAVAASAAGTPCGCGMLLRASLPQLSLLHYLTPVETTSNCCLLIATATAIVGVAMEASLVFSAL